MKPLDVLIPVKGMDLIERQISARLPLHRLWLEPNPDLWLAEWAPRSAHWRSRLSTCQSMKPICVRWS
jgi:hypothetical protein